MGAGTAAPLAIPAPTLQGFTLERNGRNLQGVALPATVEGRQLSIQVAEDLRHPDVLLDDAADGRTRDVAWLVLPVFLALSAILLLALRRVRKPLRMLAARAENLSPARPGERLPEEDVPVELLPLVRRLNGLLDRVEAAQAGQRGFVADAAHELRTPLAVLQAHMDLLRDREAAVALGQDLWVLERMVGQLLAIAELDDVALAPAGSVDLRQLARDVAALLRPLAEARGITIETRLPSASVTLPGQEEALAQAIANLLENTIGHAPEGSAVTVALRQEAALHVLDVSDAGPGIPEHERKLIFRRFWRARRRQDSRRRGVGLGLAIVQRAAVIHGGSVAVEEAPGVAHCSACACRRHWAPMQRLAIET
jgi:signal transduction histidine kinase